LYTIVAGKMQIIVFLPCNHILVKRVDKMKRSLLITAFFILGLTPAFAGVVRVDSLINRLKAENEDTSKASTLISLGFQYINKSNYNRADSLSEYALQLASKLNYKKCIARALRNIGIIHGRQGDMSKALIAYNEALKLYEEMNDIAGQAAVTNSIGSLYDQSGDYAKALECYFKTRDIYKTTGNKLGIAIACNNIGVIYIRQGSDAKALDNFLQALKISQGLDEKNMVLNIMLNLGIIYDDQGENDTALATNKKVLQLAIEEGNKRIEANVLTNMGDQYQKTGNFKEALNCITQSLRLHEENNEKVEILSTLNALGNVQCHFGKYDSAKASFRKALALGLKIEYKEGIAISYINIANADTITKNYAEAIDYAGKGLEIGKKTNNFNLIESAEHSLSTIYTLKGDQSSALKHFKAFIDARDSISNNQNTKKMVMEEMNYNFDKKQADEKAARDKKDALQQEEARKQRVTIYFVSGILLLVLGFAFFAYRSNLQKRKANRELSLKNQKIELAYAIIEEKNHEITDSINYAKRIQNAILPSIQEMQKHIPQSFVLFKPKDIVSGDFYFFHNPIADKQRAIIAVADCTGHGVPGAFMSMIGSEKLNEAVAQSGDAGEILKLLNNGIRASLHQSEAQSSSRDGMDIALCTIKGNTINFSGANRPLWVIRKGADDIEEYKATKKAIGGFTEQGQTFDSTEIKLNTGDTFYLFSDGYADQFGGENGKKLTTKKFRELLLSLKDKTMPDQYKELDTFIEKWRDNREQLDDVLVIGVRV
jgi:serine phosphatase RsbU (regulator of sigma subunit)/Tfp pilus assembly protein PilF